MHKTIGIDLGTTNTVAAIDGTVVQLHSGDETFTVLPSVVAFPPNGTIIVGEDARRRRAIDPLNTVFSIKRLMGQGWHSPITARYRERYPFELVESGGKPHIRTRAGLLSPRDVALEILKRVTRELPTDPREQEAVITVPAGFDDAGRAETLRAGIEAGLINATVVPEPIATARAYVLTHAGEYGPIAVYDMGGGTFDLAIVDCSHPDAPILAHGGDSYLGGDDVDHAIAAFAAEEVRRRLNWDLESDPIVRDRLVFECERAKVRLTSKPETEIRLSQVDPAAPFAEETVSLDRERVASLSRELISRSFVVCDEVMRSASLSRDAIDAVFLSGGGTLLPTVREAVAHYFGALPRCDFDPTEVVAIGASLMGD